MTIPSKEEILVLYRLESMHYLFLTMVLFIFAPCGFQGRGCS